MGVVVKAATDKAEIGLQGRQGRWLQETNFAPGAAAYSIGNGGQKDHFHSDIPGHE